MPRRRINIEQGFWAGGVFHPIRASDDYDPEDVGERHQYAPAKRRKKKKAGRKNPGRTVQAVATRTIRKGETFSIKI